VKAWDPDPADSVYLYLNNSGTINNGPFAPTLPAPQATISFTPPSGSPVILKTDTIRGKEEWIPNSSHVRRNAYQVDFFVHDNMLRPPTEKFLTAYYSLQIRVRPPGLGTLVATPQRKSIQLAWGKSKCSEVHSYRIYRKEGESPVGGDTICCNNTPESLGFQLIGTSMINDPANGVIAWTDTTFIDTTVEYGKTYCYVIVGNINENPISEGILTCPSNQVCVYIANEAPLLTNVSVEETDAVAGKMFLAWTQPKEVDSSGVIAPRPLNYSLYRADGQAGTNFLPIVTRLNYGDTTYWDSLIDTKNKSFTYRVLLNEDEDGKISEANPASSIFLRIQPGEKQLNLDWSPVITPWTNTQYYIWKSDSTMSLFTLLDSTDGSSFSYLDTGLVNYQKYCYYIESKGNYSSPRFIDSLFNKSQRTCDAPRDLTPPCPPDNGGIQVQALCNELKVLFRWTMPDTACAPDLGYFLISKSEARGGPYIPFYQTPGIDSSYLYFNSGSIAGCYVLQAVDTSYNASAYSQEFCVDNCPELTVGNVFTPNGDGYNDFFTPVGLRAVSLEYFAVYDRWGNLLYSQTSDPIRLWDGSTQNGPAREGVYFYVLKGDYIKLDNPEKIHITGTITLLR
jgi:gliding motility-associated-like protein